MLVVVFCRLAQFLKRGEFSFSHWPSYYKVNASLMVLLCHRKAREAATGTVKVSRTFVLTRAFSPREENAPIIFLYDYRLACEVKKHTLAKSHITVKA